MLHCLLYYGVKSCNENEEDDEELYVNSSN